MHAALSCARRCAKTTIQNFRNDKIYFATCLIRRDNAQPMIHLTEHSIQWIEHFSCGARVIDKRRKIKTEYRNAFSWPKEKEDKKKANA